MRHRSRLARIEQQLAATQQTTINLEVRECSCCSDARVFLHGPVYTVLPSKAAGRDAWAQSWVGTPAHVEAWKNHHAKEM